MGDVHLTALNVSVSGPARARAEQTYTAPCRMMEAVKLPQETQEALESMYERFGGDGLPGHKSGKDIPLGARLLALADTYADLTHNPKNPFSKVLEPDAACSLLERYAPSIFDPNLVELFKHMLTGDDLKARLLANRRLALIVDIDPEETTVLELRLLEQGFEVRVARSAEAALRELRRGEVEAVISEIDLGGRDGFALLEEARKQAWGKQLPWIVLTRRSGRADADRAFELGADDYVTKPVNLALLVPKLKQIMDRRGRASGTRGVSGSLEEMGLPDIVQVLWHGRKSGSLRIHTGEGNGEIHFVDGQIYNALFGRARGADAFYAMVTLQKGEFALDPSFIAPQRVIEESPEGLLLEGMRRLDEGAPA
jgi:DNA-binding response OmpR family regulator